MPAPVPPTAGSDAHATGATTLVVRRDHRRTLRSVVLGLAIGALLLFWLPTLIVLVRREPGYFTSGIVLTALLATVALLALGLAATWLWLRSGDRSGALLTLDDDGVQIPAGGGRPALDIPWTRLALIRVIGNRETELAFYPKPQGEEWSAEPEQESAWLDLSEPEFLRPLDFENNPPPEMSAPERRAFTEIAPVPENRDEGPVAEPTRVRHESLYGTPYVVAVSRTSPELREVLRAIRRMADGRVPLG